MDPLVLTVIILALGFDFLNGIHDSSNVVATMIYSRALPPKAALWMAAIAEFLGPFIFGVAVAETIGGIVEPDTITLQGINRCFVQRNHLEPSYLATGVSEQFFSRACGGLIGAVIIGAGWQAINLRN